MRRGAHPRRLARHRCRRTALTPFLWRVFERRRASLSVCAASSIKPCNGVYVRKRWPGPHSDGGASNGGDREVALWYAHEQ